MAYEDDVLGVFETHDEAELRRLLARGFDPTSPLRGRLPVDWLIEMYTRSARFPGCVRLLLANGARIEDPALEAVLLDDADALRMTLHRDPDALQRRHDLVSAFTPLRGATLLHVAAEYGHLAAARVLLEAGAAVDASAAGDPEVEAGHTSIFHTVNSPANYGAPVMRLLLAAGARTDVRLASIIWGRSFEWETTLFDVTPLSYCQAGLLPQMHRREVDIYANLRELCSSAGRPWHEHANVPNRYLQPRRPSNDGRVSPRKTL